MSQADTSTLCVVGTRIMPAVPASKSYESLSTSDGEHLEEELINLRLSDEEDDVDLESHTRQDIAEVAFTVLDDNEYDDDHDEGVGEDIDDVLEHLTPAQRDAISRFKCSLDDQKTLNTSNTHLLRRKLMELSKSSDNQSHPHMPKRTIGHVKYQSEPRRFLKINNLRDQTKAFSKSNGHIPNKDKYRLKKDISQSHNNLGFQNKSTRSQPEPPAIEGKKYHRYCHLSSSIYFNNIMTTLKPRSNYTQEFSNISDIKSKKYLEENASEIKRQSSTGSESYLSTNNNNNNINNNQTGMKNRQNEKNNRYNINPPNGYKNGYTRNANNNYDKIQNADAANRKPLFVSTVKSGKFLEPPPELAYLLGLSTNYLTESSTSSTNDSSSQSFGSMRDRHQQQVLLYSFSSQPRVLHQNHHKARCDAATVKTNAGHQRVRRDLDNVGAGDQMPPCANVMFDRRVIRGSNFAQHPIPQRWNPYFGHAKLLSQTDGESQVARQHEARRRALARRKAKGQHARSMRIGSPPPVAGRKHEVVQTEKYLEEIFAHPPETDATCQTDLFLDRPDSPIYVPAKTGLDAETQIYPGDLFVFDVEVQPILEVLVGKTLEQALIEVLEEDELAALRAQQRRYMELRAGEKAEEQRLEEQEQNLTDEKDRRVEQFSEALRLQRETEERVAAAMLTQGYLADLLPTVLDGLKEGGYLIDDIKVDVEEGFMPWLMGEVQQEMDHMVSSKDILTDMVRDILDQKAEIYRAMGQEEGAKLDYYGLDYEEPEPKPVEEPVEGGEAEKPVEGGETGNPVEGADVDKPEQEAAKPAASPEAPTEG